MSRPATILVMVLGRSLSRGGQLPPELVDLGRSGGRRRPDRWRHGNRDPPGDHHPLRETVSHEDMSRIERRSVLRKCPGRSGQREWIGHLRLGLRRQYRTDFRHGDGRSRLQHLVATLVAAMGALQSHVRQTAGPDATRAATATADNGQARATSRASPPTSTPTGRMANNSIADPGSKDGRLSRSAIER